MDGWNQTDLAVAEWLHDSQPDLYRSWNHLSKSGCLVLSKRNGLFRKIALPTKYEVRKMTRKSGLGQYAMELFLPAFCNVRQFCLSTNGVAVITTHCIGMSMADHEY
jgi:hypothetical protein